MSEPQAMPDDTKVLDDYVTIDQASMQVFPLLVSQLEIANQQLADGVDTLINGFTWLAQKLNDVDPVSLGVKIPQAMEKQIQRIHRFTDDLIQAGQHIHNTSISEATKEDNPEARYNINRIVLKTLDIQRLSADIRDQATHVIKELDQSSEEIVENGSNTEGDTRLLKIIMELQVEVNKMVIAFQFQDRVFQIINAVINAMKDLTDYIGKARAQADSGKEVYVSLSEMLQHVERYYISAEQYELKGEHKDDTSDDIELF